MELKSITFPGLENKYQIPDPSQFAPASHKHDFLVDVGSASYRPGMQYSGSPTNPTYVAVWEYNQSANGTQPNVLVRAIEAEKARALIGAVGYKLLWENASPASAFTEQTISLNLSDYSQVLVYFRVYNGDSTYSEETFGVHGLVGNWCIATCNSEKGSTPTQRAFRITTTGIAFSLAYYASSFGGDLKWSSNLLIPTKIYGIKGVS